MSIYCRLYSFTAVLLPVDKHTVFETVGLAALDDIMKTFCLYLGVLERDAVDIRGRADISEIPAENSKELPVDRVNIAVEIIQVV